MKKRTRRKYAPELLRKTVINKLAVYLVFLLRLIIHKKVILSKILHFKASSVYFEKKNHIYVIFTKQSIVTQSLHHF
jgi:hypothetical protein